MLTAPPTKCEFAPVSLDELLEGVSDGVARTPDPDGLHHARVAQLPAAQLPVKHLHNKHAKLLNIL